MRKIAVLVIDDVVPLDFGIAYQVFTLARLADGTRAYDVDVCSPGRTIRVAGMEMHVQSDLATLKRADSIIIAGSENPFITPSAEVIMALQHACERGVRLASICSGAFILAASGLLNGKRAVTHWRFVDDLTRLYPAIKVEPNVLFIDENNIITSAGASAGVDMCLHLVQQDYGQSVAANTARLMVAPLHRDGGQAQFIRQKIPGSLTSLNPLMEWIRDNLHRPHTVSSLAARVNMSPRTFARRFQEQIGTTPLQWVLAARIEQARELLEQSQLSIDKIAPLVGFGSAVAFRVRFRRIVGLTPSNYRHRFGSVNKIPEVRR